MMWLRLSVSLRFLLSSGHCLNAGDWPSFTLGFQLSEIVFKSRKKILPTYLLMKVAFFFSSTDEMLLKVLTEI